MENQLLATSGWLNQSDLTIDSTEHGKSLVFKGLSKLIHLQEILNQSSNKKPTVLLY